MRAKLKYLGLWLRLWSQQEKASGPPRECEAELASLEKAVNGLLRAPNQKIHHRSKSRSFVVIVKRNVWEGRPNVSLAEVRVRKSLRGRGIYTAIENILVQTPWAETVHVEKVYGERLRDRFERLVEQNNSPWKRSKMSDITFVRETDKARCKKTISPST
jgi:hypothetical protein